MTGSFAAMGMMSAASAYSQAEASKSQAEFTASQYEANQKFANASADDSIRRGDAASSLRHRTTRQQIGAQRAASAASGVDANFGSAVELQEDTRFAGEMDELTIKNNAWREANGFKVQAASLGAQAGMTRLAGQNQYRNTLITGGLQAASYGMQAAGKYRANNGPAPKSSGINDMESFGV